MQFRSWKTMGKIFFEFGSQLHQWGPYCLRVGFQKYRFCIFENPHSITMETIPVSLGFWRLRGTMAMIFTYLAFSDLPK